MPTADELGALFEEVHARNGPLRPSVPGGRDPIVTRGDGTERHVRLVSGGLLGGWDEDALAAVASVLQRDMIERGMLVSHAIEQSGDKHLHVVTAGSVVGQGEDTLTAHAHAWIGAAQEQGWGEGPALTELQLRRDVERLERETVQLRGTIRRMSQLVDAAHRFAQPGSKAAQLLETASKAGWEKARGE